jgi:nitroreductase
LPPDTHLAQPTAHASAADLIWARYRTGAPGEPPVWNDVLATLLGHRSTRSFLTDQLPDGTLELLVAAAQSAASSSNLQVWSVVAVEDPARKARLAAFAAGQKHIVQAPLFLVWLADLARLGNIASERGVEAEGLDYLELLIVGIVDAALAAQNAVVALESLGLGSVYIGAIRNNIEGVAAELGLPPRVMPVFGLCVGRPDPAVRTDIKPRLPRPVVVHRETYQRDGHAADIARYNRAMIDFNIIQNMAPDEWTAKVVERVRTPKSLTGRHRLRDALHALGFKLR